METTLQEAYDLLVDAFEHAMAGDQEYAMLIADMAGVTRLRQFQIRQKIAGGMIDGDYTSGYEAGYADGLAHRLEQAKKGESK